jgi:hypothetical protein
VTFIASVSATASSAAGSAAKSTTPGDVQAGVLGFLVVAAIGVALVFLLRSMNKQFKKIGPKPEEPEDALAEDALADHPGADHPGAGPVVAGEVVAEPEADAAPAGPDGNVSDGEASAPQSPSGRPR